MFENITVGIITLLIYGVIITGCIIPFAFIVRTKHNITKFGFGKYIFIIAGLEAVLILAAKRNYIWKKYQRNWRQCIFWMCCVGTSDDTRYSN